MIDHELSAAHAAQWLANELKDGRDYGCCLPIKGADADVDGRLTILARAGGCITTFPILGRLPMSSLE